MPQNIRFGSNIMPIFCPFLSALGYNIYRDFPRASDNSVLHLTRPQVSGMLLVRHHTGSKSRQSSYLLSSTICFHSLDISYCLFTCSLIFLPWLELGQSAHASSVHKSEACLSHRRDQSSSPSLPFSLETCLLTLRGRGSVSK